MLLFSHVVSRVQYSFLRSPKSSQWGQVIVRVYCKLCASLLRTTSRSHLGLLSLHHCENRQQELRSGTTFWRCGPLPVDISIPRHRIQSKAAFARIHSTCPCLYMSLTSSSQAIKISARCVPDAPSAQSLRNSHSRGATERPTSVGTYVYRNHLCQLLLDYGY